MPVWICLGCTLTLNYVRSTKDKSTLCSSTRKHVGPKAFFLAWLTLTCWLLPHYTQPFIDKELDTE